MNRLWVRLSLMIAGVLFFVFFLQFVSITLDSRNRPPAPTPDRMNATQGEIAGRLVDFMALSLVVGLIGGVLIARVISAPMTDLARTALRISQGELSARVRPRGSREMAELGATFNLMAAELQHAEMLRTNLMADISHELRTPLTALEGNLRAALDHVYRLDEAEIANLYGQTRHLIRLVNELRELSLAEGHQLPLEIRPTDVGALIADTLQAIEPLALEKEVTLAAAPAVMSAMAVDPDRLRQVLYNLLSNALRHTPPGGTITVSVEVHGDQLILAVADTGEGLAPEQLAAVFDRFYRADKSRSRDTGGTGLGLAITRAIVEAHGGTITATSAGEGRGTTFSVLLPARAGPSTH